MQGIGRKTITLDSLVEAARAIYNKRINHMNAPETSLRVFYASNLAWADFTVYGREADVSADALG
jgi:hypothetical protein